MKNKLTIMCLITLSGCTQYAEKFDCGAGKGVGCKSLTYVNRLVEAGRLPLDDDGDSDFNTIKSPISLHKNSKQRVWLAGHTDDQGYYHEPSYIQVRLNHGH